MNLQQLRYLREVVRQDLNISAAANTLYTSQPGISKQIKLLEEELGVDIFVRSGKRVTAITPAGQAVLGIAERMLLAADSLKQVGQEFQDQDSGELKLAATHTQARYALPPVIKQFIKRYPKVKLTLHQGNPMQLAQLVLSGEADMAIATESLANYPELVTLPCYEWHHCVVVPPKHPLLLEKRLTLAKLAEYPLITYDPAFSGRAKIDQAFADAGLTPNIALTAIDSDVLKTYVELGLGVGILADIAFIPNRDRHLQRIPCPQLFSVNTTRLAVRKNDFLRGYTYTFIELFAPQLTRQVVAAALSHP